MDRNTLFDKILNHINTKPNNYWSILQLAKEEFNIVDRNLLESIIDEMLKRDFIKSRDERKFSVKIINNGQQFLLKYKSYSSLLRSELIKNIRNRAENIVKLILKVIGGVGVIIGLVITIKNHLNKSDSIENKEIEIKRLESVIDSISIEKRIKETDTLGADASGMLL